MSKKRIGIAVMALGMFLWAAAAYASPEAPRLLSPPMALPVPSGFLKVLLLLTFFVHLVLVNVLLGSVILSVIDRRASASDRKGGVAFMPKVLALAVNFGVAPFLFLQVLYGHFLYPSIVLMAVWWMFVALFAMLAYYGLYVSDGAVRPARRTPILFLSALLLLMTAFLLSNASTLMLPGLLVPVVLRAARASFEHKRSHLISALSAYFTGFSGCGRPDDGLARPVEQA